jgi:hypothetical protein
MAIGHSIGLLRMFVGVDEELGRHDDHKERESYLEWGVRGAIAQAYAELSSQDGPDDISGGKTKIWWKPVAT